MNAHWYEILKKSHDIYNLNFLTFHQLHNQKCYREIKGIIFWMTEFDFTKVLALLCCGNV